MGLITILAWLILTIWLVGMGGWLLYERDNSREFKAAFAVGTIPLVILCLFLQTRTVVPAQQVGVTRSTFSQELSGELQPGINSKPFIGGLYTFPNSQSTEYCTKYTPSLKGSYGVTLDLCYYIDTTNVDWLQEIDRTGSLDSNAIWMVWRNSVVSAVAEAIKQYTPEQVSENRSLVESRIFENVLPWFTERGIPLVNVSLVDWDFTSETVAATFDESIVSQRRITEQVALLEAAKVSRDRQLYEAETAQIVAQAQEQMLTNLGFTGTEAINYLWITLFKEQETTPDLFVIPSGTDVTVGGN